MARDVRDKIEEGSLTVTQLADILWAVRRSPFRLSERIPVSFSPLQYVFKYRDLRDARIDPYEHYIIIVP